MLKKTSKKKNLFTNNDFEDIRLLVNRSLGLDVSSEFCDSQKFNGASSEISKDSTTVVQSELGIFITPVSHADKITVESLMELSCNENVKTPKKISSIRRKGINELCQVLNYSYFEHNTDCQQRSKSEDEKNLVSFSKENFNVSEVDIKNEFHINTKATEKTLNPITCESNRDTSFSALQTNSESELKCITLPKDHDVFKSEVLKSTPTSHAYSNNVPDMKKINYAILFEMAYPENQDAERISDESFVCFTENDKEISLSNRILEENILDSEKSLPPELHNKENKKHVCSRCLKQFKYPSVLERHICTHRTHANVPQDDKSNKYFSSDSLIVKSVDFDSETQNVPKIELRREKSIKQCSYCLRTFKVPSKLLRHIKSHVGLKSYACHLCSKTFLERYNFNAHIKTHSKEQPHVCDLCKRAFSFKCNLTRHLRFHMKDKPFICSECGSKHSSEKKLEFHVRNHQEKPYKCIDCGTAFKKKSNLTRHAASHDNSRCYPCNSCDYRARRNYHLKKHMERHHKI